MAVNGAQAKKRAAVALRFLRFALSALAFISAFLICMSGTLMVDGDDSDEVGGFLWPSLSIATFRGLIPTSSEPAPPAYGVQFFWFLNALGFKHPAAQDDWRRLGYVYDVDGLSPGGELTLPQSLVPVARRLGLDPQAWACVGDEGSWCYDPFLQSMADALPTEGVTLGTSWVSYCYYAAFVLLVCTAVRACRRAAAVAAAGFLGVAAAGLTALGARLVAVLSAEGVPAGMEARLGGGLVPLAWAACVASLVALLCGVVGDGLEDGLPRGEVVEHGEEEERGLLGDGPEKALKCDEDLLDFDPDETYDEEGAKVEM